MRSRSLALHRLCWPVVRAAALYTVEGLTALGMAMIIMPDSETWVGPADPGIELTADPGEPAPGPVALTRRERRQWARLARQLHS